MTPTPVYPLGIATDANLKVAANLIQTTLTVAAGASDTILFVSSAAGFTANGLVSIENEIIAIQSVQTSPNQTLTVATGGRGFDGTAPVAHSAGVNVSMLIDAWHHNSLASEIKAIETFLGPNGQNLASVQGYRSMSYTFAPQSPGGSLAIGNNVITLTPVPPGVNGADAFHYLYISGGTGTPEAVLITGGTAVAGAASGTVIVNCANAHSGAWTIATSSGGVQEALIAISQSTATNGEVLVNQPASAPCLIHAPVRIPNVAGQFTISGLGREVFNVQRAPDYLNGNLFEARNCSATALFRNLGIVGSNSFGAVTGASIYVENTINATFKGGTLLVNECGFNDGQYCIRSVGVPVELRDLQILNFDQSYKQMAAISLEGPYQSGVRIPASNHVLSNIQQFSGSVTNANAVNAGLHLNGVDGLIAQNILVQGNYGLHFEATANNYNTLVSIDQLFTDQAGTNAIHFSSDGTGLAGHMVSISNAHASGAVNGYGVDIGATVAANIGRLRFTNLEASNNGLCGVAIGASQVQIVGGQILTNNQLNQAYVPGIRIVTGLREILISNIQMYNLQSDADYSGGHHKYGITLEGPSTDVIIVNNDLAFSAEGAPILMQGKMTGGRMEGNTGVDDQPLATVASAASLALPMAPNFNISGTTGVTAVSTFFPAGKKGTLLGTCTFTAGASIGNTITLTAGKVYSWFWDGTMIWIAGG